MLKSDMGQNAGDALGEAAVTGRNPPAWPCLRRCEKNLDRLQGFEGRNPQNSKLF